MLYSASPVQKPARGVLIPALAAAALFAASTAAAQPGFEWDFESGPQSWTFDSPGGFFTSPNGFHDDGEIRMKATNNTDTFGFWDSPVELLPPLVLKDAPRNRQVSETFYMSEWSVTSDEFTQSAVPQFRMRSTLSDLSYTAVHTVTSVGDADYAPEILLLKQFDLEASRTYFQPFMAPSGRNALFSFDMLNIDPTDTADAELGLEALTVEPDIPFLSAPDAVEADWDFTTGTNGFTEESPGAATTPIFFQNSNGLNIQGMFDLVVLNSEASNPKQPSFIFGSWSRETDITLNSGSFYRLIFEVGSDTPEADKAEVPTFRLRVNDSSLQASWYLNLDSTGVDPRVPTDAGSQIYTLLISAPPELAGNKLIISFDYLYVGGDNNPRDRISLKELLIERYEGTPVIVK